MNNTRSVKVQRISQTQPVRKRLSVAFFCLVIGSAIWPFCSVQAQEIDFEFQIYRLDVQMADALQTRLITGGESAEQAMAKMPLLAKQGRVDQQAEVKFSLNSGQRNKAASSKRKLKADENLSVVDGLEVEIKASVLPSGNIVAFDIHGEFAENSRDGVKTRQLTTRVIAKSGVPVLLSRWQEGKDVLLFTCSATVPNSSGPGKEAQKQLYFDAIIYKNADDAESKSNPVARITFPTQNGKRGKSELGMSIKEGQKTATLGMVFEVDPKLNGSGVVEVSTSIQHTDKAGGNHRLPKLNIRESRAAVKLQVGKAKTMNVQISSLSDSGRKPDTWKTTLECHLYELQ